MGLLDTAAALISLAALLSYLNHRFVRLPTTIGLMLSALLLSLVILAVGKLGWGGLALWAEQLLGSVDFNQTLLHGMLSFLLFAGALHVNLEDLLAQRWVIASLASVGVLLSTFIVAALCWWLLPLFGLELPWLYCLLFGALISPTDPIAVLGILKSAGVAKTLETKITGESLFNDGVGVVIFLALLKLASGGGELDAGAVAWLFVEEALGGAVYGLLIGAIAFRMLKSVDNYQVEVLITLALVMGGYALADALYVSGPIAMVVAGLLIGNHGRVSAMSERTREHLDTFWELVDEVLNAILFVLIGLEVLVLTFRQEYLLLALLMVPTVLLARLLSVGLPISLLRLRRDFSPRVVRVLTWGGLRGGISVALALSLPAGGERELILAITYVVVVFSIVVQGLSLGRLVRAGS